jgi:hypothetical protein
MVVVRDVEVTSEQVSTLVDEFRGWLDNLSEEEKQEMIIDPNDPELQGVEPFPDDFDPNDPNYDVMIFTVTD